jgi:hypothetical protein
MTISNMIINQPQSPERHKNVDSRSVAGDIPEVLEFHSIQKSTIHTKQVIIDSLHTNVHLFVIDTIHPCSVSMAKESSKKRTNSEHIVAISLGTDDRRRPIPHDVCKQHRRPTTSWRPPNRQPTA